MDRMQRRPGSDPVSAGAMNRMTSHQARGSGDQGGGMGGTTTGRPRGGAGRWLMILVLAIIGLGAMVAGGFAGTRAIAARAVDRVVADFEASGGLVDSIDEQAEKVSLPGFMRSFRPKCVADTRRRLEESVYRRARDRAAAATVGEFVQILADVQKKGCDPASTAFLDLVDGLVAKCEALERDGRHLEAHAALERLREAFAATHWPEWESAARLIRALESRHGFKVVASGKLPRHSVYGRVGLYPVYEALREAGWLALQAECPERLIRVEVAADVRHGAAQTYGGIGAAFGSFRSAATVTATMRILAADDTVLWTRSATGTQAAPDRLTSRSDPLRGSPALDALMASPRQEDIDNEAFEAAVEQICKELPAKLAELKPR